MKRFLLVDGWCRIENLPNISDVKKYIDVLKKLGVTVIEEQPGEILIKNNKVSST